MSLPVIVASLFFLLQTPKSSIEGFVVNGTTDKPIAGAQVMVSRLAIQDSSGVISSTSVAGPGAAVVRDPGNIQPPAATTDSSGRFIFQNLEPGKYVLTALANGY